MKRVLLALVVALGVSCASARGWPEVAGERCSSSFVTLHVDNRHAADVRLALGGRWRARAAPALRRSEYQVARAELRRPILVKIARGGFQIGGPVLVVTEHVRCTDATLVVGAGLRSSMFYGAKVGR